MIDSLVEAVHKLALKTEGCVGRKDSIAHATKFFRKRETLTSFCISVSVQSPQTSDAARSESSKMRRWGLVTFRPAGVGDEPLDDGVGGLDAAVEVDGDGLHCLEGSTLNVKSSVVSPVTWEKQETDRRMETECW